MRIRTINNTKQEGSQGENKANEYLINLGYKIIKTNFTFGKVGEIDIIAKDGDTLVFVEVRKRLNNKYGKPEESLTPKKRNKIRKTAEAYLYINKIENIECRFDFIGIEQKNNEIIINHIKNAF
jgi:putative endonuclease